ncbi:hypothetical protein JTE90_004402 [Oedothorax gibbosus]|uniref:Uncharacterized protein n=1 Tax=Oedothorax gibbosus TaxID=931172 RepID=A0AAV6UNU1_9ARAC|nr:hypothetical protein JTE90_004402 [Oedothorax gibbosus]
MIRKAEISDTNLAEDSVNFIQEHGEEYSMLVDEFNWPLKPSAFLEINSLPQLLPIEKAEKFDYNIFEELLQLL